ncbi:MAG: alpha/beta hydrolase [Verrucomicrobia bacterium]|nr:alpha/beta hydrolase [Verrucomicrobiota bacterium]
MPFIETGDRTNLCYKDWGTGKPVVFIHGSPLSSRMWEYQITYLVDRGVRCIAYDRRGHGCSSHSWRGYDYDTLADDLAGVIDQLNLREVTFVGYSMGGGEVVRYLSRHGADRITRVVLLAATTPFILKTVDNPDGVEKSALDQVRAAQSKDFPKWLGDNLRPFFLPNTSPEMMHWISSLCLQASLNAVMDCYRAATETDFRQEMSAITVPTLIIHGDADASAPLELTGRKSARLILGSQLRVYEGAPHGLFITHMDRLNKDLLAFIED